MAVGAILCAFGLLRESSEAWSGSMRTLGIDALSNESQRCRLEVWFLFVLVAPVICGPNITILLSPAVLQMRAVYDVYCPPEVPGILNRSNADIKSSPSPVSVAVNVNTLSPANRDVRPPEGVRANTTEKRS